MVNTNICFVEESFDCLNIKYVEIFSNIFTVFRYGFTKLTKANMWPQEKFAVERLESVHQGGVFETIAGMS